MKLSFLTAPLAGMVLVCSSAAEEPAANTLPGWWVEHVEFISGDGGTWVAPNPPGADDPGIPDAFGMEWRVSNAQHVLTGRLYGIEGGVPQTEYWTFREFYHPGEKRVVIEQWGGPGIYGVGETTSPESGKGHVEMTFWLPDGRSWREGHQNIENGDEYVTDSYDISDDGNWTQNGHYVWRRQ